MQNPANVPGFGTTRGFPPAQPASSQTSRLEALVELNLRPVVSGRCVPPGIVGDAVDGIQAIFEPVTARAVRAILRTGEHDVLREVRR